MQVKYNHSEHSRTNSKNPIMLQTCQRFIPKGIVPSGSVFETNNQIILHETSCDEIWHRAKWDCQQIPELVFRNVVVVLSSVNSLTLRVTNT